MIPHDAQACGNYVSTCACKCSECKNLHWPFVTRGMAERPTDVVNHPPHYTFGTIEVIDVLEDWQLPHHLANVVKYVARAGRKDRDAELQDLKKASWYLERYIKLREKQVEDLGK